MTTTKSILIAAATAFLLFAASWTHASKIEGGETDLWKNTAVFLAAVEGKSGKKAVGENGEDRGLWVTLRTIVKIAGAADPLEFSEITFRFDRKDLSNRVKFIPAGGQVLVVVKIEGKNATAMLDADVSFMPTQTAIAPVAGLDDPKVAGVLAEIQKARREAAKAEEAKQAADKVETAGTTQKATTRPVGRDPSYSLDQEVKK